MASNIGKRTIVNIFLGIFLQAMIALIFESGGIVSGTIANFLLNTENVKWIFLLYGPLIAARGDIAVLAGKLGTGLHLGSIKPSFRNNTSTYRSLIASTITIAILDGFMIGIVTYIMNLIIYPIGIRNYNPLLFFVIPIIVLSITVIIATQIISLIAFLTFKRGLNPDVYVVPVVSAINNILITLIFAVVLIIFKPWGGEIIINDETVFAVATNKELLGTYIGIIPSTLAIVAVIYIIVKFAKEYEFKKMMKEAFIAIVLSVILGTITGVALSSGEEALIAYPQLLVALPAFIGTLADQVSISANVFITDFSTGYFDPKISSIKEPKLWASFLGIGSAGAVITILLCLIGSFISWNSIELFWHIPLVMIVTVLANIISFVIVGSLIFALSIFAFRREIDPDNFAIPLASCLADLTCAGLIIVFSFLILPDVGNHEAELEVVKSLVTASLFK